jgi:hypothetical protein
MRVERRRLLVTLGASAGAGLAGCGRLRSQPQQTDTDGDTDASPSLNTTSVPSGTELRSRLPTSQRKQLTPRSTDSDFGRQVALAGDGLTALIGASTTAGGAVDVFVRGEQGWQHQTRLLSDGRGGGFGSAVALSGDGSTALVGAPQGGEPYAEGPGVGYVFERSSFGSRDGENWRQRAVLTPDERPVDGFGGAVALSDNGSTALVGATSIDGRRRGYVFVRRAGLWSHVGQLSPPEQPGRSVALSGDGSTALLSGRDRTLAYVFTNQTGDWRLRARLTGRVTDGADTDRPVALSSAGSTALVGVPYAGTNGVVSRGAVFVFVQGAEGWRQQEVLQADTAETLDKFGASVALGAEGVVGLVGIPGEAEPNGRKSGAVSVFVRKQDSWTRKGKLVAADGGSQDRFSLAALSGDGSTALIGAPNADSTGNRRRGAAYVFG